MKTYDGCQEGRQGSKGETSHQKIGEETGEDGEQRVARCHLERIGNVFVSRQDNGAALTNASVEESVSFGNPRALCSATNQLWKVVFSQISPHLFGILLKRHLKHRIKARRGDTTQDAAKEENIEIWEDLAGKVLLDLKSGNIWLGHLQKAVYGANHTENLEQATIRQENT